MKRKKLTSPKGNYQPGNYARGKLQDGKSVVDLLLCMHARQVPEALPGVKQELQHVTPIKVQESEIILAFLRI